MILSNATVLTMDAALPRASALAIAGGRVLGGVDSREDAIASHAHERVDLTGLTVVPGFVESHSHFRAWALANHRLDLSSAGTLDEMFALVQAYQPAQTQAVPSTLACGWILGGAGWNDALAPPNVDVGSKLDIAAKGLPIALTSRDGHALLTTTKSLERLGISLEDLEVTGGVVERSHDGSFTGVLREESAWIVRRALPEDDLTTRVMASAMRAAAARGVTSIHDMDGACALQAWRGLEHERGLSLRVWVHLLAADLPHAEALGFGSGFGSDRLAIGGLKVFADGTLGSGTASLHEPELPRPGTQPRTGIAILDGDALRQLARRAGRAGLPLLIHAIGDRAVTTAVEALAATQEHWDHLPMRPRIEHAQLTRAIDLERCAQLGIALSVQPAMLISDRDEATARWGDRTSRAYAYKDMVDAGCGILLGSDAPIEQLDPLAAIRAAVLRTWHPEQAIDAETALLASTAWPADATGIGDQLGRLTPGRHADLVVLSGDPTRDPLEGIEVVATMVGGRWTFGAANLGMR